MPLAATCKRRIRRDAVLALPTLSTLAAIAVGLRLPAPLIADSLAETYLTGQAPAKERYVLEALSDAGAAFAQRALTPSDDACLSMLAHTSGFTELSLLGRYGVIFRSTRIDPIRHTHASSPTARRSDSCR